LFHPAQWGSVGLIGGEIVRRTDFN